MVFTNHLISCQKAVSDEVGIINTLTRMARHNEDPKYRVYAAAACNTEFLSGEKFAGQCSGIGIDWKEAVLSTVGETLERYSSTFYNLEEAVYEEYVNLENAIAPSEFAIFHPEQLKSERFKATLFDENTKVHWFKCNDLVNEGKEVLCPGAFLYLPFNADDAFITQTTSTGLAAHVDVHKAMLSGIYELVERDSFMITWFQKIIPPKIVIDEDIQNFINEIFPPNYELHLFDITTDLGIPSVIGFCVGEADFGPFIMPGAASRGTIGEAVKKTIVEIAQGFPYFRNFLLDKNKDWNPVNFHEVNDFPEHGVFYTIRKDLQFVLQPFLEAKESKKINFLERDNDVPAEEIKKLIKKFKAKDYNLLFRDLTTPDAVSYTHLTLPTKA